MCMLVSSVQIISRLDSQSKFQMFTLFSCRHVGVPRHTGLGKFAQNISSNIKCVVYQSLITLQFLTFIH